MAPGPAAENPRAAARKAWEKFLAEQRRRGVRNPDRIVQQCEYIIDVLLPSVPNSNPPEYEAWLRRQLEGLGKEGA